MRSPEGGYSERHLPLSPGRAYTMTARDRDPDVFGELDGGPDANGVEPQGGIAARLAGVRHRLRMLMYADNVQKPTATELEEGHHHAEHEHELQAPMEGHAADGHQFDGHHSSRARSSAPTTDRSAQRNDPPGLLRAGRSTFELCVSAAARRGTRTRRRTRPR